MEHNEIEKLHTNIRSLREQLKQAQDDFDKREFEFSEVVNTLITMLRAIPVGIGIVNNRKFGWVNDRLSNITGYTTADISGRDSSFLYESEEEYLRVGKMLKRMLSLERFASTETRWRIKDGYFIDVALRCAHLNPSAPEDGAVFAAIDITEIKRAEKILKTQRDLGNALAVTSNLNEAFELILEAALKASGLDCGGIYIVDDFDKSIRLISFKGVSRKFAEMANYYPEDTLQYQLLFRGNPVYWDYRFLLSEVNLKPEIEDLKAFAMIPVQYGGKVVGSLNVASHVFEKVPEWSRDALEAIASRIGGPIERIRLIEELEKSEERYRRIFYNATDGIIVVEESTRIIMYANNSITEILGYEIEELIGKKIDILHPSEKLDVVLENFHLLSQNKLHLAPYIPCLRKDGSLFYADIKAICIVLDGIKCVTGFFTDITDKLMIEREREERAERYERQHVALVEFLTDPELSSLSLKSAIRKTTEIAGTAMDVARTGIWLISDKDNILTGFDMFNKATGEHTDGDSFFLAEYPKYFESITGSIVINADNVLSDPRTSEFADSYFKPNNIVSILDAAIRVHGRLKGVVSFEHIGEPRLWKEDEISFAGEFADQISKILLDQGRKSANEALQASEEKYRTLVNITGTGYIILNEEGKLIDANQEYVRMTGRESVEYLLGKSIYDWTAEYDIERSRTIISNCINQGYVNSYEIDYITPHGDVIPIEINAACINTIEGIRILTLCRDITSRRNSQIELENYRDRLEELVEERTQELKKAQEKLVTSERLAVLGQFAGSVAHEIRNPLGVISNAVYFMDKKISKDDNKLVESLSRIKKRTEDISKIIDSVMNLARMEEPNKEKTDISDFLCKLLSDIDIPKNVDLKTEVENDLFAHIDSYQFSILMKNLVSNSIQSMPGGGTIIINAAQDMKEGSKGISITVSDTGVGIAEENIDKIFEPLFTTKTYGIGFGLSIVKMIIDKHDGSIKVESDVEGTKFMIFLPEGIV